MRTLVIDHPLVTHKLTALRDAASDTATFRSLTDELVTLLAYEATREIRVQPVSVTTPVGTASGVKLARPVPLIVPVLRAGIGMLDGMTRLLPMADVGFVGLRRDEESLVASTYADRLPADLTGRDTFVLDPMLATGGTLATVISMLVDRGAASVTAICLLAAPEGLRHVEAAFAADEVRVVTAAVDERLNERDTSCRDSATRATACSARSSAAGIRAGHRVPMRFSWPRHPAPGLDPPKPFSWLSPPPEPGTLPSTANQDDSCPGYPRVRGYPGTPGEENPA